MKPSDAIVTVVRPAATSWLPAVVNAGQLSRTVPAPGDPLARYTVPWTVVVVTDCALAGVVAPSSDSISHFAAVLMVVSFIRVSVENHLRKIAPALRDGTGWGEVSPGFRFAPPWAI